MRLLEEIFESEVYPAVGCTEPVSCAYAAAVAAAHLSGPAERLHLRVDRGTYKNGAGVVVPYSDGEKGNLIAAALGASLRNPDAELELLRDVTADVLAASRALIDRAQCEYGCAEEHSDFFVDVEVCHAGRSARCVLSGGHRHIERVEVDGEIVRQSQSSRSNRPSYRDVLRNLSLHAVLTKACDLRDTDRDLLRRGVEMNLALAEHGRQTQGTAFQLRRMQANGILADDLFSRTKVQVASAVDARMAGLPYPAMTSGGSGNQGIVAILTPHLVGQETGADDETILKSIAIAHAVNSYAKCFLGELSVICGCSMTAGLAASLGIVFQQAGLDMPKMTLAVSNVVGDLGGLICDGAKPGCAMKSVTSVDAALRSGFMALQGYGLTDDGVVGRTAEESMRNLSRLTLEGMFAVDPTVLDILRLKADAARLDRS